MFAKSLCLLAFALSLPYQTLGHAIITPALGVAGTAARSDVTRASTNSPCGNGVNVASAIAGSTAVQATGDAFTVTVTNFNAGKDGSTQIADAQVDPSGTGASFTGGAATITTNGVAKPTTKGSVQVSGTLPAGTTCTGGSDGASCLVSFITSGGFGNCVLISQGGGAAAGAANATATDATATGAANSTVAATGNSTTTATGTTGTTKKGNGRNRNNKAKAAGSRLARSLKVRKSLGENLEQKRSWVWA